MRREKAAEEKAGRRDRFEAEKQTLLERKAALIEKMATAADKVKIKRTIERLEMRQVTVANHLGEDRPEMMFYKLTGRGEAKPGSGRPIGVPNRVTANFRDEYLRSGKKTPIEFLLDVMNEEPRERRMVPDPENGYEKAEHMSSYEEFVWRHRDRRIAAAIQVAPYIHPKLSSVEVGGHIGVSHEDALSELE
jgi:hypothetical protein